MRPRGRRVPDGLERAAALTRERPRCHDMEQPLPSERLRAQVRSIPDWPAPGVMFRDITPMFADARTLRLLGDTLAQH